MTDCNLAWIAGVVDRSGGLYSGWNKRANCRYIALQVRIPYRRTDLVERLRLLLDCSASLMIRKDKIRIERIERHTTTTYISQRNQRIQIAGIKAVTLARLLIPFLSPFKREQFEKAIEKFNSL